MDNQIRLLKKLEVNRRDDEKRAIIRDTIEKIEKQKANIMSINNKENSEQCKKICFLVMKELPEEYILKPLAS